MKAIFGSMLFLALCLSVHAQQPGTTEGNFLQSNLTADSLPDAGVSYEEYIKRDPVWLEATAEGLDFRVFGRYARDEEYYRGLVERFERADTTLLGSDILVLYYGFAYRDEYNGGYADVLRDPIEKGNYEQAYFLALPALKKYPAHVSYLANTLQLSYLLERPAEEIYNLEWRLYTLLGWIYALGNGTEESPFTVVNVSDEYILMFFYLGVQQVKGQTLVRNDQDIPCDLIGIEPVNNEYFSGSEVWFDIVFPLTTLDSPQHWAKKITGKDGEGTVTEDKDQPKAEKTKRDKKKKKK